ncbi:hypothetical protein RIF29_10224 [Crotalaria pallida]|uniref:Uncharacterized protein n=1 Tax=Crotalaria pallida TaxID=3830 RepID=A0AAN9FYT6_CROPI
MSLFLVRSYVFGEDVSFGGVFRCTTGLADRFGKSWVFNTPLREQEKAKDRFHGLMNSPTEKLHAPLTWLELFKASFDMYVTNFDFQIVNEAAIFRYRSLTIRAPYGAVGHGGHHHSQSLEAFFCHERSLQNDRFRYTTYLCYLVYAPLCIAGPILSYNAFASQLDVPQNTNSFRDVLRYGFHLINSIEAPENMPKCINNCHNLEGFWKNWHASFNKWLVR